MATIQSNPPNRLPPLNGEVDIPKYIIVKLCLKTIFHLEVKILDTVYDTYT